MAAALSTTYPSAKRVLVDKYAEIAMVDAAQNQRAIDEWQLQERRRKAEMKKALDEQVRLKHASALKESRSDRSWAEQEQERIAVWNSEEKKKLGEQKDKEAFIRSQRAQQLRENEAIRKRDEESKRSYERDILLDIHKEMKRDRLKEVEKRLRDEENYKQVRIQNESHLEMLRSQRVRDGEVAAALERETDEMLRRKEIDREHDLKKTYARQALQYAATETMQEAMGKKDQENEARANLRMKQDAERASARDAAQKAKRQGLQRDALDVLAIQVREKQMRAQAECSHESLVGQRSLDEVRHAEDADARRKAATRKKNIAYARDLQSQIKLQHERKTMEPFLMSKHERQMNSSLLSSSSRLG